MNLQHELMQAHCNRCSGIRSHFIVNEHKAEWRDEITDDPRDDITGTDLYQLLKCAGCGHIVFRHTATHSQDVDEQGNPRLTQTYSPPKQLRRKPILFSTVAGSLQFVLKETISDLLDEIYIALHSECPRLASMGIRSLLEHVIINKVGDNGTFKRNLEEFVKRGFISESEKDILEIALEVGHASTHRGHKPGIDVLISCLDISETLINRIYLWPLQSKAIGKTIPKRRQHPGRDK